MARNHKQTDINITQWVLCGTGLASLVVSGVIAALYHDQIDFGTLQKLPARSLNDLGPRIKYVLQQTAPAILSILLSWVYVVYRRSKAKVMSPMDDTEEVQMAKNIMTNTIEQFVMLFTSQLALVTYLTGKQALNIIPSINLLFFFGRIFFFLGYPTRRTFGFLLGFQPIVLTITYVSYRYVSCFLK